MPSLGVSHNELVRGVQNSFGMESNVSPKAPQAEYVGGKLPISPHSLSCSLSLSVRF